MKRSEIRDLPKPETKIPRLLPVNTLAPEFGASCSGASMSADGIRERAQRDDTGAPPDEKIALYRSYLSTTVLSYGMCALNPNASPFAGLSWDYFFADVE